MPVPGDAINENLAVFELPGDVERGEGGEECGDSEEEMDRVDARNEVEEMAALIGAEEDTLGGEFAPGYPLAGKEERGRGDGGGEPGKSAAGDRFAEAEPLVHDVVFAEHLAAGKLQVTVLRRQYSGVEPEDAGDDGGDPLLT